MPTTTEILIGEIFGTGLLILLGDGVVAGVLLAKSKAQNAGWIVITFAWAFAVFAGVVVAGPLSGAHLNPAVTIGLAVRQTLDPVENGTTWDQVPFYLIGEFIGAFLGAILVAIHYWPHWAETEDPGLKLAVFSTGPAIRNTPLNFISEVIGTFVLVFVILTFATNGTAVDVGALGALPVAFLVLVIGLALGGTTRDAIKPAPDLGPRVIHAILPIPGKGDSDWAYSWIPVVGPVVGGVIAALLFVGLWVNVMAM